jgi:drug/metabolite transporter (DMT)-like permease
VFGVAALVRTAPLRMDARAAAVVCGGGVLDVLANALYLLATRGGPLAIVVTLSSLYPASTVVLARLILAETLSRIQIAGIACAFAAVVLIVMG